MSHVDARPDPGATHPAAAGPSPAHWSHAFEPYSLPIALVLITLWGLNFSVQKSVFQWMSPNGVLLVRYGLIMPVCSVILLLLTYGRRWPRLSRADVWTLFKVGLVGHLVHVGLVMHGMNWSTPFSSSVLIACGPLFTLLLLRVMTHEKMRRAVFSGVLIAMAGVLIFLSEKLLTGSFTASLGDLALLLAAALFSYYTVVTRPLNERLGGVPVMTYTALLSCAPIVLMASLGGGWSVAWSQVPLSGWLSLGYSVVVAAFVGWSVWGWINRVRGVARSAPLNYLMAPVAGAVSWAVGGERFTWVKILGAVLALAGVAYAQFASQDQRVLPPAGE